MLVLGLDVRSRFRGGVLGAVADEHCLGTANVIDEISDRLFERFSGEDLADENEQESGSKQRARREGHAINSNAAGFLRAVIVDLPVKRESAPGVTRTLDLRIRNPLLYPAELRAQRGGYIPRFVAD